MRWILPLLAACGSSSSSPWVQQEVPAPSALTSYSIWVSGDNDVWLGGTATWHFDGTAWSESAPHAALDFWGFAPNDVWSIDGTHAYHWNGTAWSEVPPTTGVTFSAMWRIWGAATNDIYIANQDNSRVYHYNGTTWSVTTLQFVMADALWGSGPSDIWLSGIGDLYHYNGTTWSRYDGNDEPPTVNGLWGFGPNDIWAAGDFDALSHWNGSTWTPETDDNLDSFNSLWGSATNDIYAVGNHGEVAHFNGSKWSASTELGVRQNFTMVHGSSATNVWATAVDLQAQKALVLHFEP